MLTSTLWGLNYIMLVKTVWKQYTENIISDKNTGRCEPCLHQGLQPLRTIWSWSKRWGDEIGCFSTLNIYTNSFGTWIHIIMKHINLAAYFLGLNGRGFIIPQGHLFSSLWPFLAAHFLANSDLLTIIGISQVIRRFSLTVSLHKGLREHAEWLLYQEEDLLHQKSDVDIDHVKTYSSTMFRG